MAYRKFLPLVFVLGLISVPLASRASSPDSDTEASGDSVSSFTNCTIQRPSATDSSSDTASPSPDTGHCDGLKFLRRDTFSSSVRDFRLRNDTALAQVVTADSFLIFRDNRIGTGIELDSATTVHLNERDSHLSAKCRDLSEEPNQPPAKSLECTFLDRSGTELESRYFSRNARGVAMVDTGFLVSEGGKLTYYDVTSDTSAWTTTKIIDGVSFSRNHRYLLVSFSGRSGAWNELRRLDTGEKIGRNKGLVTAQGVDPTGNRLYQVTTSFSNRSRNLRVLNGRLNILEEWSGFPFEGRYDGRFDRERNRLLVPLSSGVLLSAHYQKKTADTFPFPSERFTPESFVLDEASDQIFFYGPEGSRPLTAAASGRNSRVLVVFDLRADRFRPVSFRFSRHHYDYSTLERPELRVTGGNRLIVNHPRTLELYEFDFD